MEGKSRLPMPTSFAKASALPKPVKATSSGTNTGGSQPLPLLAITNMKNRLKSNPLKRRSRSFTDLTQFSKKAMLDRPTNVQVLNKKRTAPTLNKNSAENDNSAEKSKPVKQPKVPSWDFKTRYKLLKEEHDKLKEAHQSLQLKCENFASIENENLTLKEERDGLLKKAILCDKLTEKNDILRKELAVEKEAVRNLTTKLQLIENENIELNTNLTKNKTKLKETEDELTLLKDSYTKEKDLTKLLQDKLIIQEKLRRQLHNNLQDLKGTIRVFCRVRPPVTDKEQELQLCQLNFLDESSLEIATKTKENSNQIYKFDKIFCPKSSQKEVFEELAQLIQSALDGYNVCIFAYGQTGSGKTYTMQGSDNNPENLGMIPRSVDLIFNSIDDLKTHGWSYTVHASFLEIYNENLYDLLSGNQNPLDICFNQGRGTTVTNLTIKKVETSTDMKNLMVKALESRKVAETYHNERSSRSHAVTQIYLEGTNQAANLVYIGMVSLVDLAGSESAKMSVNDDRLVETKKINRSLMVLSQVMLALHSKNAFIPYRNSKLTYLLQSSLGGNSKTLMIVNTAPFEQNYAETLNSLRFASKVREVKTFAKKTKIKT